MCNSMDISPLYTSVNSMRTISLCKVHTSAWVGIGSPSELGIATGPSGTSCGDCTVWWCNYFIQALPLAVVEPPLGCCFFHPLPLFGWQIYGCTHDSISGMYACMHVCCEGVNKCNVPNRMMSTPPPPTFKWLATVDGILKLH